MKILLFKIILLISIFLSQNVFSKNVTFKGLSKLTMNDIRNITSVNIDNPDLSYDEINTILKDLYNSELIKNIEYSKFENLHIFKVVESKIIENIYINGNIKIKDDIILSSISSKNNLFVSDKRLSQDIKKIRSLYESIGYDKTSVNVKTERYSNNRVNLIIIIDEGYQSKLVDISFEGNKNFSDKYLGSIISSKSNNFYNIFSSGSNLNKANFKFDISKIKSFYKDKGFFDIEVSYSLYNKSLSKYLLIFNIDEGNRYEINNIEYKNSNIDEKNLSKLKLSFEKKLKKNNNYFDYDLIEDYLIILNQHLFKIGLTNDFFSYSYDKFPNGYNLTFIQEKLDPVFVNKVNITGNSITKDKTLRSKILIEPGDIYNKNLVNTSQKKLNRLKYVNKVTIQSEIVDDNFYDINIEIDENKKTGNFLFGGSFSGDTGLGFGISLKDYNLFGSGSELDSTFNINAEQALFKINYSNYSVLFPNLKNSFSIFNQDNDLTNSFGYKVKKSGIGYTANFEINENITLSSGVTYESSEGYSGTNSNNYITDNIGDFQNLTFDFILKSNKTNDFLYPTDGSSNRLLFKISPSEFSDDAFYQVLLNNEIYFQRKDSKSFFFTDNNIGFADSLSGKLKTKNAFSLGGLNFKGFDYRGIGPFDNKIYLGGNNYFTSTIGYGSSFLFDEKDNVNIKLFLTAGSLWGSDYTSNNDIDLRISSGLSFDILTAVGPLSLTYAIPIEKSSTDKIREFNFTIGTSF